MSLKSRGFIGFGTVPTNAFPRRRAINYLQQVVQDRRFLDHLLKQESVKHANWLQEICAGVLRYRGRLEAILDYYASKKKPRGKFRWALLMAFYQVLVQERTQKEKAVHETVDLVKQLKGPKLAGLANAVLRKLVREQSFWQREDPPPIEGMHQWDWYSLPEWMGKIIADEHGEEWTLEFAKISLERPVTWVRVQDPEASALQLPQDVSFQNFKQENTGKVLAQDISSQLLVDQLWETLQDQIEKTVSETEVLDLCAAPGGKAIALGWQGFSVTATDSSEKRSERLKENIRELAQEDSVQFRPFERIKEESQTYDLVWIDAPCSATGLLRRHPEVRWLRQQEELPGLVEAQKNLIQLGLEKTKPGGFLMYSVCSVLKAEGENLMAQMELSPRVVRSWFLSPVEFPYGDGFYAALLKQE